MATQTPVRREDTVAPRLQQPTSRPASLNTKQLPNTLLKAHSRPRRTTLPLQMPNHTRHPPTRHHRPSSLRTHTATHPNNTAPPASHHRLRTSTKEHTRATQVPHNIRNIANTDKYQVLRRDSPRRISTDIHKDWRVSILSRNMAEGMGSNNHQHTVASKGDTLPTRPHRRVNIPLNPYTARVRLCSTAVIPVMEAMRSTRLGIAY